jgi:hypothetical protein
VTVGAVVTSVAVNVAHAPSRLDAQLAAAVFPVSLAACAHLVFTICRTLIGRERPVSSRGAQSRLARLADAVTARAELALSTDHQAAVTTPGDQLGTTAPDQPVPTDRQVMSDRSAGGHPPVDRDRSLSSNRRAAARHHYAGTGGNLTRTAELVGASRATIRKWRDEDGDWPASNGQGAEERDPPGSRDDRLG